MKPKVIATLLLALLGGSTQALAGNGGYHGGNNGYHGGYHGNGGYHGGNGGYNGYHGGGNWYRPAYYPYPYYYGYHHNNNNYNNGVAYALGGLVVGSLLTNAYYQNRAPAPTYVQTYQPATQVVVVPQGRHLLRDLTGNCYERTTDAAGNELRTELPPADCNW